MTGDNGRVSFTLNGEPVDVSSDHPHLLAALREELDVLSPKDGCAPMGQCGCCTVLVDGKARISCSTGLDRVAGSDITTLEGFDEEPPPEVNFPDSDAGGLRVANVSPNVRESISITNGQVKRTREVSYVIDLRFEPHEVYDPADILGRSHLVHPHLTRVRVNRDLGNMHGMGIGRRVV